MTLRKIVYGDVTGDGSEEAIVTFDVNTDGNAGVDQVYIYTLKNHGPRFLWGFEGGDRAEGGLRQAYADHSELVIELLDAAHTSEDTRATLNRLAYVVRSRLLGPAIVFATVVSSNTARWKFCESCRRN